MRLATRLRTNQTEDVDRELALLGSCETVFGDSDDHIAGGIALIMGRQRCRVQPSWESNPILLIYTECSKTP